MKPVLISRVVVPGRALAAHNVDTPRGGALAVAINGPAGWRVATGGGVIAERLDQRQAKALMLSTARDVAAKLAAPLLSFAAVPAQRVEVTSCPF